MSVFLFPFRLIGRILNSLWWMVFVILEEAMFQVPIMLLAFVGTLGTTLLLSAVTITTGIPLLPYGKQVGFFFVTFAIVYTFTGGTILLRRYGIIIPLLTDLMVRWVLIPVLHLSRWFFQYWLPGIGGWFNGDHTSQEPLEIAPFDVWLSRALHPKRDWEEYWGSQNGQGDGGGDSYESP